MTPVRSLVALLALSLAACGGGDGPSGDDLPQSFRFTVADDPCWSSSFTVDGAREAQPLLTGQFRLSVPQCAAAAEGADTWDILCTGAMTTPPETMTIHLDKSLDGGNVVFVASGDSCDKTEPMLTVEILTP